MPPVRRQNVATRQRAENANEPSSQPSVNDLRQQCLDKGLSDHGRRNTLVARLQQHASTSSSSNAREAETRADTGSNDEQTSLETTSVLTVPRGNPNESPLLNDAQLAQIQSIIARTVQQSVNDIATNAARAAVQAMASAPLPIPTTEPQLIQQSAEPSFDNATAFFQTEAEAPHSSLRSLPASTNRLPYGQSFHDVPAVYVKKIQSGEFFELSKLLPKNLFNTADEQPVMLTLENSVIKVKPCTQSTSITDIEKWTTAFTTYMSVFTHEFPNRAQEFLQYLSIIRHAAQCHKGVGWCIYDIKFRRKAALNQSLNWSEIDQQLWLMIFTVHPAALKEEYPLFNNGPQQNATPGAEQGGICRDFNRTGECRRSQCKYRHVCNRCYGEHPGNTCPGDQRTRVHTEKEKVHSTSSYRQSNQAKR